MRGKWVLAIAGVLAGAAHAQLPVQITDVRPVPGATTACPNSPQMAHRYFLSDGRTVVLCGPEAADPVALINGAQMPGLVVSSPPTEDPFVPEVPADAIPQADPQPDAPAAVDQVVPPAVPAPVAPPPAVSPPPVPQPRVMQAPAAPKQPLPVGRCANERRCYVQLGAFAEAQNVERAKTTIRALRLPVSTQQVKLRDGRVLTGILAGPLTAEQAEQMIGPIRKAGYRAAVLR